jgi:glycosyltransferase involved in cell wall biosynthesis
MNTTVSIIIPCFNASGTVAAAVQSAISQTYGAIEVLLVDDASTDKTADVIRILSSADARILAIYLTQNVGPSSARNAAIKQARGEWIVLLDADDLYEAHRVEALVQVAQSTGAELVADNIIVEDYPSGLKRTLAYPFKGVSEPVSFDLSSFLLAWTTRAGDELDPGYLKPLIKRSFLIDNKLEFTTKYPVGEDFLLFAECLQKGGRLLVLPQPGYIYRRRADSITLSGADNMRILATMNQDLMLRWREELSANELQTLQMRQRLLDQAAEYQSFRAALGSGAPFKAARDIIHSPRIIREVIRRLWRRVS